MCVTCAEVCHDHIVLDAYTHTHTHTHKRAYTQKHIITEREREKDVKNERNIQTQSFQRI